MDLKNIPVDEKLFDVKEIKEVWSVEEVNEWVGKGWKLHSVYPNPNNRFMYLLLRY